MKLTIAFGAPSLSVDRYAPAAWTHGGMRVCEGGESHREASLNLMAIRALGATSQAGDGTFKLLRTSLGLLFVSFTVPHEGFLREGCQLVPDTDRETEWTLAHHDGRREPFLLSHEEALGYTEATARAFGVAQGRKPDFKSDVV